MEATSHGASRISAKEDVEVGVNRIAGITPNRISTGKEKRHRYRRQSHKPRDAETATQDLAKEERNAMDTTRPATPAERLDTPKEREHAREEDSIIVEGRRKGRQALAEKFIGWRKVTD